MSETVIIMLSCATSYTPSLDMGCVSLIWMLDGEGHRSARPFSIPDRKVVGDIHCDGCGFEPDTEARAGIERVLQEYLDGAELEKRGVGAWATTPCHIVIKGEEN